MCMCVHDNFYAHVVPYAEGAGWAGSVGQALPKATRSGRMRRSTCGISTQIFFINPIELLVTTLLLILVVLLLIGNLSCQINSSCFKNVFLMNDPALSPSLTISLPLKHQLASSHNRTSVCKCVWVYVCSLFSCSLKFYRARSRHGEQL
jgi:hypothetical protein